MASSKPMYRSQRSSRGKDSGDFFSLKMISDHRTEMYVKFAKVMIIFQGPFTQKRLSLVETLASKFKYATRVISDETYQTETCRYFKPEQTADFHEYFKSRAKKACEDGFNLIVINQSMSNSVQMRYYFFLAQEFQYVVLPVPPLVTNTSFHECSGRCIESQANSFKQDGSPPLDNPNFFKHLYCGWFLHDVDTRELSEAASLYVEDCFDIPEFEEMLCKTCNRYEFKSYYNLCEKKKNLAYGLVKIFTTHADTIDYISSNEFNNFYGAMSKLFIVGFIISPHMIAARVKLTHDQKKVWTLCDDLDETKFQPTVYPTELLKGATVSLPDEKVTLISSKSNPTIVNGNVIHEPTEAIPHNAKGRSCHIVLGTVKNAPEKNINYDVPFAVFRERTVVPKYSDDVKPYELEKSMLRRIGKYWFIYLKETIVVNGFFATCCSAEKNIA